MSDVAENTTETTEEVEEALDYTYANGKPATPLQARFAEWLMGEEVGYDPEAEESKTDAFKEGVRYAVALRIPYQASDHNRAATAEEREERQLARAKAVQEREERRLAKLREAEEALAAKKAAADAAPEATEETKPAPKKSAPAATPAAKPAAKRAPVRKATAGSASSAPF